MFIIILILLILTTEQLIKNDISIFNCQILGEGLGCKRFIADPKFSVVMGEIM